MRFTRRRTNSRIDFCECFSSGLKPPSTNSCHTTTLTKVLNSATIMMLNTNKNHKQQALFNTSRGQSSTGDRFYSCVARAKTRSCASPVSLTTDLCTAFCDWMTSLASGDQKVNPSLSISSRDIPFRSAVVRPS